MVYLHDMTLADNRGKCSLAEEPGKRSTMVRVRLTLDHNGSCDAGLSDIHQIAQAQFMARADSR